MLIPVPGRIATRNVARGPSAVLILTTHLTTEGGPRLIEGALQEYEAVTLEGTAQFLIS